MVVLRGVAALYVACFTFLAPDLVVETLLLMIGVIAMLDGFFGLSLSMHWRGVLTHWWLFLIEGLVGILLGIVLLYNPDLDFWQLLNLIVFWATITGTLELVVGLALHADTEVETLLLTSGTLTLVFGLLLLVWADSMKATLLWLGSFAFVYGVLMLALGAELRRHDSAVGASLEAR